MLLENTSYGQFLFHKNAALENLQPALEEFSVLQDISQEVLPFKQTFPSINSPNTFYQMWLVHTKRKKGTNLDTYGRCHPQWKKSSHTLSTPFPKGRVQHPKPQQCSTDSLDGATASQWPCKDSGWRAQALMQGRAFILSHLWLPSPPHQGGFPKAWERGTNSHKN